MTRVLSVQTPLLGNRTYGELLRRMLAHDDELDFRALWSDAERLGRERTPLGRIVYRVCYSHARRGFVRERNADFYALRYELGSSYWTRRLLARELAVATPDVLHLHTQGSALLSRDVMRRIPTVISADMTSHRAAEQSTLPGWRWTHALHHVIEGVAFREAAALVAFSRYAARSMVAHYAVDASRVWIIPPGVDLRGFGDPGAHRHATGDGVRRILFVGGEFERKGGHDLVAAFSSAFADRLDVELHLVTDASVTVPKHPRIFVHTDVRAYTPRWLSLFARAAVFALPSRREAYGLAYLEAGAARLPVIGSRAGAGPELVLDGETGFLVDAGDRATLAARLTTLVDDPALAHRFGEYGRWRVEQYFDAAKASQRLAGLFAAVAKRGTSRTT